MAKNTKLTHSQRHNISEEPIINAVSEEVFLKIISHAMALFRTMPQYIGDHLINDDYDVELGFVLGFDTAESAAHALNVLRGPGCFGSVRCEITQKFWSKEETGIGCDHYAIYVKRLG